ncbi:MAG: MBL fold metallo-hydrolase [Planctomycetes bacterium]|nr:MBL fold metallo-hydrolase [Planctomycetota bacterium]
MSDFFEIDFLDVQSVNSGDAIPLRYQLNGNIYIHVVDGGYQETGEHVVKHIRTYYGKPTFIDNVVVTHPDGDHAGGLRRVLEEFDIGTLWMLRPWLYADELIDRFSRFTSVDNLIIRLKELYPNIAALEKLAIEKQVTISEPFQGARIGEFIVMAPSKSRYLDLVVESDKTPESAKEKQQTPAASIGNLIEKTVAKAISFLKAVWGIETFSAEETSFENEMSVIQYASICDKRILLTGDAGRTGLSEAADYAPDVGLMLPHIDYFQVPHHGSRRNVSTEILDRWLGPRLSSKPAEGEEIFEAIISASKKDKDHPRKAVIRATIHRGGATFTFAKAPELCSGHNAPVRAGWVPAPNSLYPEEQEE